MAYTRTGRPRGRPKSKEYGTIAVRVPADLIERVKRYASVHRCSISELLRDGLEMRLESGEVPGRAPWLAQDNGDTPPSPDTGETVLQQMFPMLHAAIQTAVREALHTVLTLPSAPHGDSVIQQPIPVLQQEPGGSQDGAEAREVESPSPYDASKYYLGKLCPKGHGYASTGKTLLSKHNNGCRLCENERKRERRALKKAAQAQEG